MLSSENPVQGAKLVSERLAIHLDAATERRVSDNLPYGPTMHAASLLVHFMTSIPRTRNHTASASKANNSGTISQKKA